MVGRQVVLVVFDVGAVVVAWLARRSVVGRSVGNRDMVVGEHRDMVVGERVGEGTVASLPWQPGCALGFVPLPSLSSLHALPLTW